MWPDPGPTLCVQQGLHYAVSDVTACITDQYNALMALCAGKAESKGRVEAARVLINRGAVVNSHDRYMCQISSNCMSGIMLHISMCLTTIWWVELS